MKHAACSSRRTGQSVPSHQDANVGPCLLSMTCHARQPRSGSSADPRGRGSLEDRPATQDARLDRTSLTPAPVQGAGSAPGAPACEARAEAPEEPGAPQGARRSRARAVRSRPFSVPSRLPRLGCRRCDSVDRLSCASWPSSKSHARRGTISRHAESICVSYHPWPSDSRSSTASSRRPSATRPRRARFQNLLHEPWVMSPAGWRWAEVGRVRAPRGHDGVLGVLAKPRRS